MKAYTRFCLHLKCKGLNIYWSEECFEQKPKRKVKYTLYAQYTFSVSVTILQIKVLFHLRTRETLDGFWSDFKLEVVAHPPRQVYTDYKKRE
jgi:hypothetical protein